MYMTDMQEQFPVRHAGGPFGAAITVPVEKTRVTSARSRCGRKRFGYYPGEREIIDRMLQMRGQGAGFDRIASHLNADGARSRSGKPWHGRVVNRILKAESSSVQVMAFALIIGPEDGK